ncbi:MAG: response regulator transcription factor [Saprospiraceae bacterium]|nr:response regulator transcription factor [Saprospiraceae bacterium]
MQPNRQYPVQEMERVFSSVMAIFADMERTTLDRNYRSFAIAFVLLITASTGLWWLLPHSTLKNTRPDYFGDKVNLALRRTAHYLMAASGDSTSTIAPVEKTADNTWQIRMERNLNYDLLPSVLQESLERHNIHEDYDVEVLKCRDSTLQLGYNFFDFQREGVVPCGGRDLSPDCYNLVVRFLPETRTAGNNGLVWALAASGLLTGIFLTARWRRKKTAPVGEVSSGVIQLGNSSFHPANQTLQSGRQLHKLTYREAKLLHLFASNPNQLLEREFILQSVWADEGILVGRSVDVFVSRLRKLLRDDPTVRITAVHGVGYRLETEIS